MLRRGSPLLEHVDERLVHVTQRRARSLGGLPSAQIGLLALLLIAAVSGLLLSAGPRLRTSSRSPAAPASELAPRPPAVLSAVAPVSRTPPTATQPTTAGATSPQALDAGESAPREATVPTTAARVRATADAVLPAFSPDSDCKRAYDRPERGGGLTRCGSSCCRSGPGTACYYRVDDRSLCAHGAPRTGDDDGDADGSSFIERIAANVFE